MAIYIKPSPTADTRSCDFASVGKQQLRESSVQHIRDVSRALEFFILRIRDAAADHDVDKLTDIDSFHADFATGFEDHTWWDRHRTLNRHHLLMDDGVPADVNLIDVLDMIADCIMAGMARTGTVYPLEIPDDVLRRAFENTVSLLKNQVVVEPATEPPPP